MKFKRDDLWTRLGFSYQSYSGKFDRDHILSHQTRQAKLHMLAGLLVRINYDPLTGAEVFNLDYQRMLPDGQARNQSIMRIETTIDKDGYSTIGNIRIQSKSVFQSDDIPALKRTINRVLQAFSTQTHLVRRKGDIGQSL